jgi:hypothetical protein
MRSFFVFLLSLSACSSSVAPSGTGGAGNAPDAGADAPADAPPLTYGPGCSSDADCPSERPQCFVGWCVAQKDVPLGCVVPNNPDASAPGCDAGDGCVIGTPSGAQCTYTPRPDGTPCVVVYYAGIGPVPGTCSLGYCCSDADGG